MTILQGSGFRVQGAPGQTGFRMDVKTNIKSRLPSRHVTEGEERASHRSCVDAMELTTRWVAASDSTANAAPRRPVIALESSTKFDAAEIFKKTPYAADLKLGGRYVAKDIFEIPSISLLTKTLLDRDCRHGDCFTVKGRTIAENLKAVKWNPHQNAVRSADKPVTVSGGVVGSRGNLALRAVIGGPIALVEDGNIIEIDADERILDVKLTDEELAARKTKRKLRATNHTSGALWTYAQQVGPAIDCAVRHPGGALEKQCYADI